nr:hypothetical protein [Tanacetum cinerariifolium]
METKDTLSSCTNSKAQQMEQRAFATIFGQDIETFTGTMFLNVEQLEKQLDKEDFQEIGSMVAFNAILEFYDTLIQHLESFKNSIDERSQHKRKYDSWVNERQMQTIEEKANTSKALDASLVDTESSGTESKEQDTSSRSENDAHADDADIRPIYDEEPMVEVQTTAEINVFAIGQQYTEQPEFNNEGEVDQNAEECHDTHSRNSRNFSDSKHFVCSTCQKCVFSANHDSCLTKFLKEVNSCAKVPSNKTTNKNKPVEQISVPNTHERQIPTGHRFSNKKTYVVQKKTTTLRSCLRWKPTGRIFKTVGLRWVPTGKILASSTTKIDSEPLNGIADITNQYECEQTLDVGAGTLNLSAGTSCNSKEGGLRVWLLKRQISHKPGLQGIFN